MGILRFIRRVFSRRKQPSPRPRLHHISGMKLKGPEPKPSTPAPQTPKPSTRTTSQLERIKNERIAGDQARRLPSPLAVRPRINVRSPQRQRGGPPPLPGVFSPADAEEWTRVSSSWIWGLRFETVGPVGMNPRALRGYVYMRVLDSRYPIYRYGPGIRFTEFGRWLEAASKGKHWWRQWTARWSPAAKV